MYEDMKVELVELIDPPTEFSPIQVQQELEALKLQIQVLQNSLYVMQEALRESYSQLYEQQVEMINVINQLIESSAHD